MVIHTIQGIEGPEDKKYSKNVFGVYDYTSDQMYTHSYKQKTSKQFLDFIKLVDQKYDTVSNRYFWDWITYQYTSQTR